MSTLEEFTTQELDRLSREREEAIKAKGGLPYLGSIPVGESRLVLLPKIPVDDPAQDGRPRKGFHVMKPNGSEEYSWTVNVKSPLYRDLLKILKEAPDRKTTIRVIRTGEGRTDTRYTVKKAE
ncbi:hypothetical protein AUG19_02245 [archaeon 13_1_20CM_2_54_9]|nr:MAG: hypothetical protein AUJ07_03950 [Crenarchaeota archaeon 13_1_40CM_3_53_5]OLE76667.1 MAG: hypothetical protein AUG19_02245 [archaeon 13_1_20CM_2_54_9]